MARHSVLIAALAAAAVACATAGGAPGGRESCALPARDSVFVSARPVYRDCAVDRRARFVSADVDPNFRPELRATACYFADLEFVVDSLGKPEIGTARVVRTNYGEFGKAVLETLQAWKYEPAVRDGKTVRQIVMSHQTMSTGIEVVAVGSPPPVNSMSQRSPTC